MKTIQTMSAPAAPPRFPILQAPIRKLDLSDMHPAYNRSAPPPYYRITLTDRESAPNQLPLFEDIVSNLEPYFFFPDELVPIRIALCSKGLREAQALDMDCLRRILWLRNWIHPKVPITFEPKGAF